MKKTASALPWVAFLAFATLAHAGIVVDEQQLIDQPPGRKINRSRTVMIEGDKQKSIIDNGKRTVITDLGKGTMTMLDGVRKTYVQFPFPPKGNMAAMQAGLSPTISFKKTGEHETLIGYSCDDYSGSGTVGGNSVNMLGCFSNSAPGAVDYMNFQRQMADKVKGTPMANMGQIPQGVPLRLKITTKIIKIPTAGMSAQQASSLNQMLANKQFVTDTTVSKISSESLPAASFDVPSGYQKQGMPSMFGGMGGGPVAAPSPRKLPQ